MLSNRGAALRNLLDGVFASSPTARPDAAELLQRLRSDPAVPGAAPLHDASFDRGLREFDEVIERKRASLAPAEPESPPPAPPPPGSHRRRWWPGNGALGLLGVGL
jgi:hypothetical protein